MLEYMNSFGRRNAAFSHRFSVRQFGALVLILTPLFFSAGCARVKGYSINSYQGPMPMTDQRYLETPPTAMPR